MNDDRTNIIVSQQRRDLVFGDWTSATIYAVGIPVTAIRFWYVTVGASLAAAAGGYLARIADVLERADARSRVRRSRDLLPLEAGTNSTRSARDNHCPIVETSHSWTGPPK